MALLLKIDVSQGSLSSNRSQCDTISPFIPRYTCLGAHIKGINAFSSRRKHINSIYSSNERRCVMNDPPNFCHKSWFYHVCIFTHLLRISKVSHKVIFHAQFNMFEFRVFLLLGRLSYQGWRTQSTLIFIHFPRVLVLCEMQTVSFRIWTLVTVSIFFDDNHYATSAWFYHILSLMNDPQRLCINILRHQMR